MKVWVMTSVIRGANVRMVVAAPNQKVAAKAFWTSVYTLRQYASVTGNDGDIQIAMTDPGTVFVQDLDYPVGWQRQEDYKTPEERS